MSHKSIYLSLILCGVACAEKEKTLEQLAEEGDPVAQYEMGRQYYYGDQGRSRDFLVAYQWFVRAAMAGGTGAQNTLGVMLQNGEGVGADLNRAREWYELAANVGHPQAQSNLGHLYAMGIGVEKNIVKAYQWFALSAEAGDSQGRKNLAIVKRFISPEELEAAKARVTEWHAQHR
ncbi:MAG: sel1 repeat family protein [Verrucomicrobia subdivision 3 bacterium]|nr:sel1 repeat family protein [Limisphaerales bacterium]